MKNIIQIMILFCSVQLYSYNLKHATKLKTMVTAGTGVNASHCDFRGLGDFFKGLNFTGIQFTGALFGSVSSAPTLQSFLVQVPSQVSDLSKCNFKNATLVSTSFESATLHKVNFNGADIAYANFSNADLTGAKLDGALNADLALFCGATMPDGTIPTGSTWTSSKGNVFQLHCSA